ncbi:MAG: sigma-70 family RNA polymerase sigma factor, partial [Planctomycetes bacterium]|nr:sigma-70 family RNA polymerase sigma factor [Planctomycetota bacterium]
DDRAALAASLEGDGDAFGVLVERYQEVAFRTAYLIVRDAQTAEDVCQEGFLRAHDNLHRFRIDDPFRPWLLRIVKNLALNHVRSRGRREGLLARLLRATPGTAPAEAGPERTAEAREQRNLLLRAVDELREEDRVVLYLRHFLDLPEAWVFEMGTNQWRKYDRWRRSGRRRLKHGSRRTEKVIQEAIPRKLGTGGSYARR